jgi:hypothetical protein
MLRRLAQLKRQIAAVVGNCDGIDNGAAWGWAWRPGDPRSRVDVELWVDGVLVERATADRHRADLEAAGIGDGAYGFRLSLALDPAKADPQTVEVRVAGGALLPNGTHERIYEPLQQLPPWPSDQGQCDGRDGDIVHGWACRLDVPEQQVVVEQWVDGALVAETVADLLRADLSVTEIGHAHYGWSMRLRLDPAKREPQTVELRIKGAGLIANGRFQLTFDEIQDADAPQEKSVEHSGVVGRCDGLKGPALYGWAWDPSDPEAAVEVELWIEGACVASCVADGFRPDLRSNGVGNGRYGWRLPLDLERSRQAAVQVEVRAKGGAPLEGGVLELRDDLSLDDPANLALRPFVEAVLNPGARPALAADAPATLLLYLPAPTPPGKFWAGEHDDYPAALRAFTPALETLGETVVVEDLEAARAICAERRDQGRRCLMFSFGPPRLAPLSAPCPVIPAFAWAFPAIPTSAWDGDPRCDWRNVLAFTGRAITFSSFAADAVRAAMGSAFPIAAIAPPAPPAPLAAPDWRRTLRLNGVVFDSREHDFDPEKTTLAPLVWRGDADLEHDLEIEGVLFTASFDFKDGRSNWRDLVSAFIAANRERSDTVLLLNVSDRSGGWRRLLYRWLAAQPRFACRVIAVRGAGEENRQALVAATNWCVSAANAAGLCLPLQDFLAAGRPAIAPAHTAFADLLDAQSALFVDSDEEDWRWPLEEQDKIWSWAQHPDDVGPTTQHRVSWTGLVAAFAEACRLSTTDPDGYARLSAGAADRIRAVCDPRAAACAVQALLASEPADAIAPGPSPLMQELAAG